MKIENKPRVRVFTRSICNYQKQAKCIDNSILHSKWIKDRSTIIDLTCNDNSQQSNYFYNYRP